jgi:hypothetical protein
MPFTDKSPAAWLGAGYDASTGKISFNTANAASNQTLPQLTDTEADETTGDIRKVLFALIDGIFTKYDAKYSALDTAARPSKVTFTRSATANADGSVTRTYLFVANLAAPLSVEVADEA